MLHARSPQSLRESSLAARATSVPSERAKVRTATSQSSIAAVKETLASAKSQLEATKTSRRVTASSAASERSAAPSADEHDFSAMQRSRGYLRASKAFAGELVASTYMSLSIIAHTSSMCAGCRGIQCIGSQQCCLDRTRSALASERKNGPHLPESFSE